MDRRRARVRVEDPLRQRRRRRRRRRAPRGTVNTFSSGIAGNATIPGAELTKDSVTGLQAAAKAGTLHVRFAAELKGFELATDPEAVNTLASFTSRGVHGSFGDIVKPDIAGPASTSSRPPTAPVTDACR